MSEIAIQQKLDAQARRKELLQMVLPYMGLIAIFLFFLIVTGGKLLNEVNRANLINQCFTLCVAACGGAFVYAHGGSDMSIAATCGCGQVLAAVLMTRMGWPLPLCILACMAVTILGSVLTASIGLIFSVPVFIGSMCIRSVFGGILNGALNGATIFVSQATYPIMSSPLLKLFILILLIGGGYYLFEYTPFGKQNRAIGGNPFTASHAGIQVKRVQMISYIILGVCVGIAAIFQMFRNGEVSAQSGTSLEFNLMLAVILGGMPMRGGEKSRFLSPVIGAITVAVLENGMVLWGLDIGVVNAVKGILFVAIIGLSYDRSLGKLVT